MISRFPPSFPSTVSPVPGIFCFPQILEDRHGFKDLFRRVLGTLWRISVSLEKVPSVSRVRRSRDSGLCDCYFSFEFALKRTMCFAWDRLLDSVELWIITIYMMYIIITMMIVY